MLAPLLPETIALVVAACLLLLVLVVGFLCVQLWRRRSPLAAQALLGPGGAPAVAS